MTSVGAIPPIPGSDAGEVTELVVVHGEEAHAERILNIRLERLQEMGVMLPLALQVEPAQAAQQQAQHTWQGWQ